MNQQVLNQQNLNQIVEQDEIERDDEFVQEAISSVLFAQLDQIEGKLRCLSVCRRSNYIPSKQVDGPRFPFKIPFLKMFSIIISAESFLRLARESRSNSGSRRPSGGNENGAAVRLPAFFRQNIYWPPYKKTLAHLTSLPLVEAVINEAAVIHDRLKGIVIFGRLYKFNVWWVSYLQDCAKEALRIFRKASQRLTPPGKPSIVELATFHIEYIHKMEMAPS